jgi:hypothetical protein
MHNLRVIRRNAKAAAAVLALSTLLSVSAQSRSRDVVAVVDLNYRYADCQPQRHTYDLKKYSIIYYGASILCQVNVAFITYDRKYKYQGG